MKNFYKLLSLFLMGIILCLPNISNAQTGKKKKPTPKPTPSKENSNSPVAPSTTEAKWVNLKVEGCGFSIDLPSKPEKVIAGNGPMWIVTLPGSQFWVACNPLERASVLRPDGYLEGAVLAFPGEVKNKQFFNVTDFPGTIAVSIFGITDEGLAASQFVCVIPRKEISISATVLMTKEESQKNSGSVKKFIGSLKFF